MTTRETVVVASVPADHVYVRHIAAETPDGVVRLSDPQPDAAVRSAEQSWWPPVMLDPAWVDSHAFDVFHVQFGFDAITADQLREVVDAVHARGRSFVYTAHDLRNPHHRTSDRHDAQLDVLMEHADAVVTLTDSAAAELARRWGREALVVPHPHVVELETMARFAQDRRGRRTGPFRVGVHVKSVRASMDPMAVLPTLVRAVRDLPDAVLQVNGHRELLEPDGVPAQDELATFLRESHERGDLELHVHDFMSDDEFFGYLASLDLSVLPYRFGTHSGWLEACRDLGTGVAAPTCGFYADQGPVHSFDLDEHSFDEESLVTAVKQAYAEGAPEPLTVAERRLQRRHIAQAHRDLYDSLATA